MDDEQFKAAMESDSPTIESIEEIAIERKRKSEAENKTAHENNVKAAEEAKRKAEEEAKKKMEESDNFPVNDFFSTVFAVPKDEEESSSGQDETDVVDNDKKDE